MQKVSYFRTSCHGRNSCKKGCMSFEDSLVYKTEELYLLLRYGRKSTSSNDLPLYKISKIYIQLYWISNTGKVTCSKLFTGIKFLRSSLLSKVVIARKYCVGSAPKNADTKCYNLTHSWSTAIYPSSASVSFIKISFNDHFCLLVFQTPIFLEVFH